MKKRYWAVALILMFSCLVQVKALVVGDCDVLIQFKQNSSLDEDKYICKGRVFGADTDSIYYSGSGNVIKMKDFTAYYMVNYGEVTIDISGNNNVSLFHASSNLVNVTGNGSFKFKEVSYVKKVINGGSVFNYEYKGTMVLDENKKIYEGTNTEFTEKYETLKKINKLPETLNLEDYIMTGVDDYTKTTAVVITDTWFLQHIKTTLNTTISSDGYGIVEYVKPEEVKTEEVKVEEPKKPVVVEKKEKVTETDTNTTLKNDDVIFVSDKKLNKKYKLSVKNKKEDEVAEKVEKMLRDSNLLDLYDISVLNGKKEVTMKDGSYIIKIKLDSKYESYENFKVIYVNDDGEIEEYIDTTIEDGYIVFKTSHLSQYGIIATPMVSNISVIYGNTDIRLFNYDLWFKVLILLSIAIMFATMISYITLKSNLLPKKKRKKRRA